MSDLTIANRQSVQSKTGSGSPPPQKLSSIVNITPIVPRNASISVEEIQQLRAKGDEIYREITITNDKGPFPDFVLISTERSPQKATFRSVIRNNPGLILTTSLFLADMMSFSFAPHFFNGGDLAIVVTFFLVSANRLQAWIQNR